MLLPTPLDSGRLKKEEEKKERKEDCLLKIKILPGWLAGYCGSPMQAKIYSWIDMRGVAFDG